MHIGIITQVVNYSFEDVFENKHTHTLVLKFNEHAIFAASFSSSYCRHFAASLAAHSSSHHFSPLDLRIDANKQNETKRSEMKQLARLNLGMGK
jgi:hypothetical protein